MINKFLKMVGFKVKGNIQHEIIKPHKIIKIEIRNENNYDNDVINQKYNEVIKKFEIYYGVSRQHRLRDIKLSDMEVMEYFANGTINDAKVYDLVINKLKKMYFDIKQESAAGM